VTKPQLKDPKKVEAGRKSAEVRKRNKEAILKELIEAKKQLAVPEVKETEPQPVLEQQPTNLNWKPLIFVGGAVLTGAIYLWYAKTAIPVKNNTPKINEHKKTHQLNIQDPFCMY